MKHDALRERLVALVSGEAVEVAMSAYNISGNLKVNNKYQKALRGRLQMAAHKWGVADNIISYREK